MFFCSASHTWQMGSRGRLTSLSHAEKGVKSKAEREKNEAGRHFSINGRKQGKAPFISRWEKQLPEELNDSQSADYNSSLLHCQEEKRMEQQV